MKIECDIGRQSLVFTVSESGPGIPKRAGKVAKRFHDAEKRYGTGPCIVRKRCGGGRLSGLAPSQTAKARF